MGQKIKITAVDDHKFDAYRADPDGKTIGRLVVIQEIFGVNDHIRIVCDRFAQAGYVAIAPAMFDRVQRNTELGYDQTGLDRGKVLKDRCTDENALRDIVATRSLLAGDGPVGIVGFCWGGSLAWLSANIGIFEAAVCYYGGQIVKTLDREPLCPIMLHFGEKDRSIPLADVSKIKAAYPTTKLHVYQNAEHGFACDVRSSFNKSAAKISAERTLEFLRTHL